MADSEIIEHEGRRFERTGERRIIIEAGEWYMGESAHRHPLQCTVEPGFFSPEGREILRELPAETPAQMQEFCTHPMSSGPCNLRKVHPIHAVSQYADAHKFTTASAAETPARDLGLAEIHLQNLVTAICTMHNLYGEKSIKFLMQSETFRSSQALLARIRASKEERKP